jgi:hypothetical protein
MKKKIILFLIPFLITTAIVVGYFKLIQKISTVSIPNLPSVSFSDLVKFSRFSLEKAPSQSLVGLISSMSGDVEYESRIATEAAKINSPVPIQQGENLTTGTDGKLVLIFEKAAEINISPDTSVSIIQTLPADLVFSQSTGVSEYVKLASIPVSIRSRHLLIENAGDITVSVDKIKPVITVSVNSGSATFAYNNINNISKVLTLEAGKTLTFNDGTRRVVVD